jgi:predicted Rossmann fold flavoprotein
MLDSPAGCLVAVVGGGAAGLMAAITAAQTCQSSVPGERAAVGGVPVVLLEKLDRVGKKLLTTGNGRCNLSNWDLTIDHYHGLHPDFALEALTRYTVSQTIDLFRNLGLPCRTEEDGRIYPYSLQASAVLDILRQAVSRLGIRTETSFAVRDILAPSGQGKPFILTAEDGRQVTAQRVVVTTGGLAAPGCGCDGSGYAMMERLGHRLTALFPALVQIRTETDLVKGLAGIKFVGTATARAGQRRLRTASGEILFTDYGLSGPPLLDISRAVAAALLANPAEAVDIHLDLLPDMNHDDLVDWLNFRRLNFPEIDLQEFLTGLVNKKLGQAVLKRMLESGTALTRPASVLSSRDISRLASFLKKLPLRATGTRDWTQAQVTAGGLETGDFRPDTMESQKCPGLYAAGEILDIDGDCGGFNLQWAWSSGQAAGHSAMLACLGGGGNR